MSALRRVPDPYRELGVARGATDEQVKAAHRRLAKRYHPDLPTGDRERFLTVQEAYQLLSDPLRRREWDRRHAPGPVHASEAPARARTRPASGRWTREDAGTVRRPRSTRPRPTPGSPEGTAGDAGEGSGARAWEGSGRDPGARTHTWSAAGVPWWEDFSPRQRPGTDTPAGGPDHRPDEDPRAPERPRHGRRGASDPQGGAPDDRVPGGHAARGDHAPPGGPAWPESRAPSVDDPVPGGHAPPVGEPALGPAGGPLPGRPAAQDRGDGSARRGSDMDVFSRSSGAAWSMAARRYFRRDEADLPRGGVFMRRGTQVVTGAEARRLAEEQRREAAARLSTPGRVTPPSQPPDAAVGPAPRHRSGVTVAVSGAIAGALGAAVLATAAGVAEQGLEPATLAIVGLGAFVGAAIARFLGRSPRPRPATGGPGRDRA